MNNNKMRFIFRTIDLFVGITLLSAFLYMMLMLFSCTNTTKQESTNKPNVIKVDTIYHVLKTKQEKLVTTYHHVFSIWKGDFVLQPDIKQIYYFSYTDGTYEQVNLDDYLFYEPKDTIIKLIQK